MLFYDEIHTITYNTNYLTMTPENLEEIEVKDNFGYVPDKRLYPETCDYEFCKLLKEAGVHLPFTSFNSNRKEEDFYGFTLWNLIKSQIFLVLFCQNQRYEIVQNKTTK